MPYGFNNDKSKFDLNTLIGSMAQIETSPATASHAVGDFIVVDGLLHKVISAIATGESLVVGTNIELTSTGAELTDLKSDITPSPVTYTAHANITINDISINKSAGFIVLNMSFTPSANIPNFATLIQFTSSIGRGANGIIYNRTDMALGGLAYILSSADGIQTIGGLTQGKQYRLSMVI